MPSIFCNLAALALSAFIGCTFAAGPAPVLLGTAANFAILAKTGVSTVPNSAVTGNVGVSPATVTSLTGFSLAQDISKQFWTSTQVTGHLMGSTDASPTPGLLTVAVENMQSAYVDASNRPLPNFVGLKAGLIGGSVLVPGLYKWTTGVTISTGITLSGGPADTWIFQIAGTLVQAANVKITLIGGAQSKNIIWAVAGTVTVGANGVFQGNILAATNVVIETSAIDNGCIYAQTDVALQKATVLCSGGGAVPPPTSSPASSSTASSTSASSSSTASTSTSVSTSSSLPPTSVSSTTVHTTSSTVHTTSTTPYTTKTTAHTTSTTPCTTSTTAHKTTTPYTTAKTTAHTTSTIKYPTTTAHTTYTPPYKPYKRYN
ncbi:hypothetical protein B0H16DRAFT_1686327 [Mycena metata]|uniref:Antifreeze protein n=1 Tax=Mycena metata TaxID=1033252 RepID=A0AAD7JPY4_9AGAR|nr:hypothetical protein B0H16DRAFT_1686327 [Mycena metata]